MTKNPPFLILSQIPQHINQYTKRFSARSVKLLSNIPM